MIFQMTIPVWKLQPVFSEILELDYETVYQKTLKENYYEVVQKRLRQIQQKKINEFKAEKGIGSIYLVEDSKRYYPYNNFASTVIGFTGADNQGLYGIEAYYDAESSSKVNLDVHSHREKCGPVRIPCTVSI